MPKVNTAKAAKDYPNEGIKKGDLYYSWAFFRGPTLRSKTPPRRSQITGSANLSAAYAVEECLEDALGEAKTVGDVVSALEIAASDADNVISDYDDQIGNLEQAFQGGCPALEEAQEKRDGLESWKGELESAKDEVEALDREDFDSDEEMLDAARDLAVGSSLEI